MQYHTSISLSRRAAPALKDVVPHDLHSQMLGLKYNKEHVGAQIAWSVSCVHKLHENVVMVQLLDGCDHSLAQAHSAGQVVQNVLEGVRAHNTMKAISALFAVGPNACHQSHTNGVGHQYHESCILFCPTKALHEVIHQQRCTNGRKHTNRTSKAR